MALRVDNLAALAPASLKWLIVLGMAYTLASTVLFLAAPEQAVPMQPGQSGPVTDGGARPGVDLQPIVTANLFGVVNAGAAATAAAAAAAAALVDTRLPLVLHGVFVAENAEESTAILARKGRSEQLYRIGDNVPGNATLEAVYLNYVLLRRGRTPERLAFPKHDQRMATPSSPAKQVQADALDPRVLLAGNDSASSARLQRLDPDRDSLESMAEQYRDKLKSNPQQALDELGITPVSDEQTAGYRIDRLAESPYLRQTGLQPGDVILSVNGQPVGDVGHDRLEIDNLLAQGSARIEVQRGDRRFFITAALK